jgi:hypothetical protein
MFERGPLASGEPAPDPVALGRGEREEQALAAYRAVGAHGLGSPYPSRAPFDAFAFRLEEQLPVDVTARRALEPAFVAGRFQTLARAIDACQEHVTRPGPRVVVRADSRSADIPAAAIPIGWACLA